LYQEKSQALTLLANTVFPTSQKKLATSPAANLWTGRIPDLFPSEVVKLQNAKAFPWTSLD
jgi:hypothetical protein